MDALPIIFTGIATIVGVLHFVLTYAKQEEEHRRRFNEFLFGWIAKIAPTAAFLAKRLFFLGLTIGTALIVWKSVTWIHGFLGSSAALTRSEVFHLLLNLFNAFAYGVASLVGFSFTVRRRSVVVNNATGDCLLVSCKEGDVVRISLDVKKLGENFEPEEIIITVSGVCPDLVTLGIEVPKAVKVLTGGLSCRS